MDDEPDPPSDEAPAPAPEPVRDPGAPLELALASVELSPDGQLPVKGTVALVAMANGGRLDIVMARGDAALVQEALSGEPPPRPRTHDLLQAVVAALGGEVVEVALVERRPGGLFVARVTLRTAAGAEVHLDARPSDAINVALRSPRASLVAAPELVIVPEN